MKKLITVLFLLFAIPFVVAETTVDVQFTQDDGNSVFTTATEVQGNFWNYPNAPQPDTSTARVFTRVSNTGTIGFTQHTETFGTGLQYPNINENEWSMFETQETNGYGETEYEKQVSVWTVHVPYTTNFEGAGLFDTLTQDYEYSFSGSVNSETPTFFGQLVGTDEVFSQDSWVWINPFN